ncbi:hypothetical protein QBC32DRAFT_160459 [Pseudoneurospora amorphoporcata]|uniref:Nucleoporin Pom152 n=1 Tax=Pseudoneurospora amorphoporcata TaxID=241081 RepID=A0AAN6NT55_9PEZI|nr:hypothetical protein QBC32DRAFT_160459 [Pseudoneurospora amorphoporcata]
MAGKDSLGGFPMAGPRRPEAPPANRTRTATPNAFPVAPQRNAPAPTGPGPVIPLHVIDAPTQRLYAVAIYAALFAWKLYDWTQVVEENTESFWLFLKWIALDLIFLFGLPELRIPWLELSQSFVVFAFVAHALVDWMLMFNIGLPWQTWLFGFVKVFYDRELAITEHQVKVSSILYNHSLLMGRQIINILPEGSVVLNPENTPYCIGGDTKVASIPLFFNATTPIDVEIIRTDLETNEHEVLKLTRSQLKEIKNEVKRNADDEIFTVKYNFPAKKPGAYRLGKALDEYKLEVHRRTPLTFVVPCPRASVGVVPSPNRCVGDLSDLSLLVDGTPPLKVIYSRTINGKDHSFNVQSLQPEGFSSPLLGASRSLARLVEDDDVSWARAQRVPVSLNESMNAGGAWQYSVDEVHDAFGNVVRYTGHADDLDPKTKPKNLVQNLYVKERPRVRLEGCDVRNPLKVARGGSKDLPIRYELPGPVPDDTTHTINWQFSPIDTLTKSGDHGDVVSMGTYDAKNARDRPRITTPGLYTIKSVVAGQCEGEVQEPSSCLLLNPLEPKLTLRSEEIPDTCAGNSIGLRVDMDLIGTPPFNVRYEVISNGQRSAERIKVNGLRFQQELIPRIAGHHKYVFTHIGDAIYEPQKLSGPEYTLEQDVKPAASASIMHSTGNMAACLNDDVSVDVLFQGDAPFTLEWEVIHDGKRKQHKVKDIQTNKYQIKTGSLAKGGEYTLALTSVQDKRACRNFLQDEVKISVRRQNPRAAFGLIDAKRRTMAVEGSTVKLPLRLTGEGPWKVFYSNVNDTSRNAPRVLEKTIKNDNDFLDVRTKGIFQITDVWDRQCHGIVDPKASSFEVNWFARPELAVVQSAHVQPEGANNFVVSDVCEGDVSGFEVALKGTPPFHVEYQIRHQPASGPASISRKDFEAALGKGSVSADTSRAGQYTYTFNSLSDNLYNNDRTFKSVTVKQKVNQKPTAAFVKPGQTFKYCKTDQGESESIPIALNGVPPFNLEFEIRHQSSPIPEVYRTPAINSNSYEIQIPRHQLRLGTQTIRIRSVRDGSGCHSISDYTSAHRDTLDGKAHSVQIQLFEAPTIYPLETRTDYCVGERLGYSLAGAAPFEVWYTFNGEESRAKSPTTTFRRIAEHPGEFTITSVSDRASECRAPVNFSKTIHPLPAARISKGKQVQTDIHEGGEVEILFEFYGTPPFEFTYTRSTNPKKKGERATVLETKHDISDEYSKVIKASQEGAYEVVAIKDRFCAFSTQMLGVEYVEGKDGRLLKYQ